MATLTIPSSLKGVDQTIKMEVSIDKNSTLASVLAQVKDETLRAQLLEVSHDADPHSFLQLMINGHNMNWLSSDDLAKAGEDTSSELYVFPMVKGG